VGLTTLTRKKEKCREASKKFIRILWRRPRPKLGRGAKERKKERKNKYTDTIYNDKRLEASLCTKQLNLQQVSFIAVIGSTVKFMAYAHWKPVTTHVA
jgi:phosphoglycerate-specific signal transduction histidine kinase